jgi:hypothetical protein
MDTNVDALTLTAAASADNLALAWQIQRSYQAWAREHSVDKPDQLDARNGAMRLRILQTIIETTPTGYGAADARFLAGRLLWNRNDLAGAVSMWRRMGTDERTVYAEARRNIRQALAADGSVDVVGIVRALAIERSRWLHESGDRLARFGYTPATF